MIDPDPMREESFMKARSRVVLALDVAHLDEAVALAQRLSPYVATVKIGLELFLAEGSAAVRALSEFGVDIFLDLKLHDIPTTVERSARVVGSLGVRYLTLHTSGGETMLRAGVAGLVAGADAAGYPSPLAVGVTVLTSDPDASAGILRERTQLALSSGCGAFVCAAPDLKVTRAIAPELVAIVPGTRLPGVSTDDQSRTATPREAIEAGADLLVIGRPILRSRDPERAALELLRSIVDIFPDSGSVTP